ncbi:hypothetical protein CBM2626_U20020 [Cupriavidus taiwanensis]|nr:hypothetical protein CBM2626_U20020 [Cupriavidus taiwanensis]SPA11665.1 protein of unknown function [Cupriavidus taiwanensis]
MTAETLTPAMGSQKPLCTAPSALWCTIPQRKWRPSAIALARTALLLGWTSSCCQVSPMAKAPFSPGNDRICAMTQGLSVRTRLPLAILTPPSSMLTTFQPPSSASPATTGTVRPLTSTTALNWPSNARNDTSLCASPAWRGIRSATPAVGTGPEREIAGAAPAGAAPWEADNSDSSARFTSALYFAISARAFHNAICDCNAASSDASVCRSDAAASTAAAAVADAAALTAAGATALAPDGCAAGVDAGGAASCCDVAGRAVGCAAGCDAGCLRPAAAIAAEMGSDMEDAALAEQATDCSNTAAMATPN